MFRAIAYCTDPDCRCEHRPGIIIYEGPSREDAQRVSGESRYFGRDSYSIEITTDRERCE